jgi:hypothetical protein
MAVYSLRPAVSDMPYVNPAVNPSASSMLIAFASTARR